MFVLGAHSAEPSKIPADEPSTDGVRIDEAHRTSPTNVPQKDGAPRERVEEDAVEEGRRSAAGGNRESEAPARRKSDIPADEGSTDGVEIDEAHRTSPRNIPDKHHESR